MGSAGGLGPEAYAAGSSLVLGGTTEWYQALHLKVQLYKTMCGFKTKANLVWLGLKIASQLEKTMGRVKTMCNGNRGF